jgi:serine/threonine protein kinase
MLVCPRCSGVYPNDARTCPRDGAPLGPPVPVAPGDEELSPGTMVGEYRIEGKLGEGGFGAVYRAVHPVIHKAAAVKILNRRCSSEPSTVARFVSEARIVNQIRHANIVDIFAFGQLPDGRHYHVMQLLEGVPLNEHLRERGRLSMAEAYPILRGVARALAAAHAAEVVHRDLKPANVFLIRDEDRGLVPKLIDFGIAKLLDDDDAHKTKTGALMGTAYFMSPEQGRGRRVDTRSDIYSFGVMTHTVLTGKKLFTGESAMDVVMKHVIDPPPPMSSVCSDVPAALDEPVLRMLEKDPARRPQTIALALEALESAARACGALPEGRPSLPAPPAERPSLPTPTPSSGAPEVTSTGRSGRDDTAAPASTAGPGTTPPAVPEDSQSTIGTQLVTQGQAASSGRGWLRWMIPAACLAGAVGSIVFLVRSTPDSPAGTATAAETGTAPGPTVSPATAAPGPASATAVPASPSTVLVSPARAAPSASGTAPPSTTTAPDPSSTAAVPAATAASTASATAAPARPAPSAPKPGAPKEDLDF